MKSWIKIILLGFFLLMCSCEKVKPYQRMYLNDEDMKLGTRTIHLSESSFLSYREGSAGANGGKSGGGCGCN